MYQMRLVDCAVKHGLTLRGAGQRVQLQPQQIHCCNSSLDITRAGEKQLFSIVYGKICTMYAIHQYFLSPFTAVNV